MVSLADLSLRLTLGRASKTFAFPAADNAVFVPLVGISDAVTSRDDMTLKPQNYAQLVIDPDRSDARFVARFLNSELGRTIRETTKSGSVIPKLNTKGIRELRVFVPPLSVQRRVLELSARISAEENTVLSLQGELSDLNRDLWAAPTQLGYIDRRLKEFSKRMGADAASYAAATREEWFESLPFRVQGVKSTRITPNGFQNNAFRRLSDIARTRCRSSSLMMAT